jgi:hypothetical protein
VPDGDFGCLESIFDEEIVGATDSPSDSRKDRITIMRIIHLKQDRGKWGWTWTIVDSSGDRTDYCTNVEGDGLFVHDVVRANPQCTGTCQFSLCGCTYDAARGRIARYFAD